MVDALMIDCASPVATDDLVIGDLITFWGSTGIYMGLAHATVQSVYCEEPGSIPKVKILFMLDHSRGSLSSELRFSLPIPVHVSIRIEDIEILQAFYR